MRHIVKIILIFILSAAVLPTAAQPAPDSARKTRSEILDKLLHDSVKRNPAVSLLGDEQTAREYLMYKAQKEAGRILPPATPYKNAMLQEAGAGASSKTPSFGEVKKEIIRRLEQEVLPAASDRQSARFWRQAISNLQEHAKASGAAMSQNPTENVKPGAKEFIAENMSAPRIDIGPRGTNPFDLPEMQKAKFIFLGEEHTRDLPAQRMIEDLIAYNKTAPEGQKITHVFVEFAYQLNKAMEFVRAHKGKVGQEELFDMADFYAYKEMGKFYMPDQYGEIKRWLYLGYRLLEEAPEITFFAYDIPGWLPQRNRTAFDYASAMAATAHARAVFITGAGHSLRSDVSCIALRHFKAAVSIPSLLSALVPQEQIVSVFMLGGTQKNLKAYGGENDTEIRQNYFGDIFLDNAGADAGKSFAIKTDPQKYGFDYYFHFPAK